MAERKSPDTINKLDMLKSHRLVTLLLDPDIGFTAKKMGFRPFAAYATEKLGFPVTSHQVLTRVTQFQIPHGEQVAPPDQQAMGAMVLAHESEINDLKERLARLEGWVNTTFPSKSPLKVVG